LSLGFLQRTFDPMASNPLDDSAAISYDRFMPVLGFRQGPVDIILGYTRYQLQGRTCETVMLAGTVRQEIQLAGEPSGVLLLPVMLSSDFTKAESAGPQGETFGVASVGVGAGVRFRSTGRGYDASVEVSGLLHYSLDGLGTGTGFSPTLAAEASLFLPDALSFAPLAVGYRLRIQSWKMSDDAFNYRSVSHGPYIGVGF